ncbi:glycogen synthase GlgA [Herbaspirillum sp. RTI4]|uniref:glycogen synthase GlgA n=1 Tax=Herbaspirillum sp. RTI4 TaxID=3048640 RepID=UPI002AB3D76E|nr:glycogen synthase GlgA [Herbaspirillum sp. RTI4]MDY7579068.1 glycogen synthase GlgA [Herbaspirillum sp. RTI4]MEA9982348.1 glycogen synthase GlgA [Herbaspirillum sp. RTI4]
MQPRVLIVTSEAVPLIKTGGLADVITALALALRAAGVEATVMMPGYATALEHAWNLQPASLDMEFPGGPGRLLCGVMPGMGVPVVLVDTARFRARTANPYVDDSGNEFTDNALCFADLAHAALAVCAGKTSVEPPHVVHANDWHTGLIPALLKLHGLEHIGTMLTIHNIAFQGNFDINLAPKLGIPESMLGADGMEYWGKLSFLKAGITYADRVTTVSESYAREILTPEFGFGMEDALNLRKKDLSAIVNGIDTEVWDPADDQLIARHFSVDCMKGKGICKRDLQTLFGLIPTDPFAPIMGIGSRMSHQKMVDVVLDAVPAMLERHSRLQIVVLGKGEHEYEQGFLELADHFRGRIGVHIGYDERRAHALHAGSDMLLHPSRFEPFGLTPLYAMRYGAMPIASRVGGLIDSIIDAGKSGDPPQEATGVLFDGETAQEMLAAVDRALEIQSNASNWQRIQDNIMRADFGWDGPTANYIEAYAAISGTGSKRLFDRAKQASDHHRQQFDSLPDYHFA